MKTDIHNLIIIEIKKKMENKKCHFAGTIPKSNIKTVESG
jgi:hypothetical protein